MATITFTGLTAGGLAAAGAAGLATAAAGALGLGLVAAAVGGRRRRGRRRYYYGRRRGRRQAQNPKEKIGSEEEKEMEEDEAVALKNLLDLIRYQDVLGCGMRFMCDLAATNETDLDELQLGMLNLVEPLPKPGEGILPPGGAEDYKIATMHGKAGENCLQYYPFCPLTMTQQLQILEAVIP